MPPVPQRRDLGRDRAECRECGEHRPCFIRPAKLQQRQGALQVPMAQRRLVLRQRRRGIEQGKRISRTLLLQKLGNEVEPDASILRCAREALAQQRLTGLDLAADTHEGTQIGGGRGMAGCAEQRLAHRRLGVLDVSLPVTRDAVIDPGVGPTWCQLQSGGESAFGVGVIAQRRPGLPVSVMSLGPIRRGVTGVARGLERGQRIGGAENVRRGRRICLAARLEGQEHRGASTVRRADQS